MDRAQIKEIMRDIFGRSVYLHDNGGWVSMRCPLAPYTHESGRDTTPSAGVSVNDDGSSGFNCFTCKSKGPFSYLLKTYAEFSGEDLGDLIDEIEEGEFLGPRTLPGYDQIRADRISDVLMPIDEGIYMDLYDSAVGHPYLAKRGISKRTTKKLELLYDPKDPADGVPRILFPVRGPDGLLYGFSGRATRDNAKLKVRDYAGLAKARCVLGAHFGSTASRIVTVEGLIDYAAAHEHGECGCAVMHSSVTDEQAAIFKEIEKPNYLMLDDDLAGKRGTQEVIKKLEGYMPLLRTKYPRVKIEDDSEQGWHWLKDPGETTKEEFLGMLEGARLI